ncbi:MAG: class I SAM-dependent methyltransferase, partial [Oscillospiraceae bacterium]|nr:class I SAM-dependent methyltransferase [Oscillospiraceae bacterium]
NSPTYGKVCKVAFGIDLKQLGMMTMNELDVLFAHSNFAKSQKILEVGCGAGHVAAYISQKTSTRFLCIDVDEKVISYATAAFKDNNNLCFRVLDVRRITEVKERFDKILAIDSLYFVSDMQADTYLESLKTTITDLHALLDKGGELIVFYSELPFFKPDKRSPECTQLGICLEELGLTYIAVDLTDGEIIFWREFKNALIKYKQEFIDEGSEELFSSNVSEAEFFIESAEKGHLYRNLYLIKK